MQMSVFYAVAWNHFNIHGPCCHQRLYFYEGPVLPHGAIMALWCYQGAWPGVFSCWGQGLYCYLWPVLPPKVMQTTVVCTAAWSKVDVHGPWQDLGFCLCGCPVLPSDAMLMFVVWVPPRALCVSVVQLKPPCRSLWSVPTELKSKEVSWQWNWWLKMHSWERGTWKASVTILPFSCSLKNTASKRSQQKKKPFLKVW